MHRSDAPASFDEYRVRVCAGLRAADCVVAPSANMLSALRQAYGPLPRALMIPNGIDLSAFGPRKKEPWLLSAGRLWDAAKNLEAVRQVAGRVAWPTSIAGPTRAPDGHETAHETACAPCRPLGMLSRAQLAERLARASIYVAPARYEPFGLSILEAAASGCALVLGRIPSLLENWADAACFVDPEDPAELQSMLSGLIADDARRVSLAARAQQRSRQFPSARMADAYLTLYASLAGVRRQEPMLCAS